MPYSMVKALAFVAVLVVFAAGSAILGADRNEGRTGLLDGLLISVIDLDDGWTLAEDSQSLRYNDCAKYEDRLRATVTFTAGSPRDRVLSHLVDRVPDEATANCAIDFLRDVMASAVETGSPLPTTFLDDVDVGDESFGFEQIGTVSTRQVIIWRRESYISLVWNEEQGTEVNRAATDRLVAVADARLSSQAKQK